MNILDNFPENSYFLDKLHLDKLHKNIIEKYNEVYFTTKDFYWVIFMNDGFTPLDSEAYPTSKNCLELEGIHKMWKYQSYLYIELLNQAGIDTIQPLGNLLDIGCGRGGGASVYEKYFNFDHVVGMDLNPNQIDFCNRVHSNIQFDQGSAMELPYDQNSFDIITNVESAGYYVDYESFLRGLNKILKVNGLFLCADTGDQNRVDYIKEIYPHYGFEVRKHIDITKNVSVACAIEKYRMMDYSEFLSDIMMNDEERYFPDRWAHHKNPRFKKDNYHIFVIEKKETV